MIKIERPAAPAFLLDPNDRWQEETNKAIEHYSNPYSSSFEFKMYNHAALKDELKKVFVKCAYCESSYGAVYDGDVEHFRPKGKVNEKNPQTPGYYWLANDWDNLFLACQHCNQRRKHILVGDTDLSGYGKLDQFPLNKEDFRLRDHNHNANNLNLEEQERLLLNPCKDDPSLHFAYENLEGVVVPLTPMGKRSVEVYVLKRPYLVQERKKQMLHLFKQIQRVKRELERLNNDRTQGQKEIFEEELQNLMDFTKPESSYAGMSRFFVKSFLKENNLA